MSEQTTNTNLGAMSTATTTYVLINKAANQTNYEYISTFNGLHPTTPYKFKSNQERLSYLQGNVSFNCSYQPSQG